VLSKLSPNELEQILGNALSSYPEPLPRIPTKLLPFLADVSDGDARQALNSLELAMSVCQARQPTESNEPGAVIAEDEELMNAIKRGLRKGYDRTGEERYDMISAMHKSIRGSEGSAAMYWLARMLEGGEDPLYVARRLIVVASEDVGLADPHALPLVSRHGTARRFVPD
jgi:putative ATPase